MPRLTYADEPAVCDIYQLMPVSQQAVMYTNVCRSATPTGLRQIVPAKLFQRERVQRFSCHSQYAVRGSPCEVSCGDQTSDVFNVSIERVPAAAASTVTAALVAVAAAAAATAAAAAAATAAAARPDGSGRAELLSQSASRARSLQFPQTMRDDTASRNL